MKPLIATFISILFSVHLVFAAARAERGRELAPHIEAIEHRIAEAPLGMSVELSLLQTEYGRMAESDEKAALGVVLRAASANDPTAQKSVYSTDLDAASREAAERVVQNIRESSESNAKLRSTLNALHAALWHGEESLHPEALYDGSAPPPIEKAHAELERTLADGQRVHVKIAGVESATPPDEWKLKKADVDPHVYDVIVVGAGYSGLAAAWWLRGLDNLLVDRSPSPGGLAYQGELSNHVIYAQGAAYVTKFEDEVKEITDSIGFPSLKQIKIRGDIDNWFLPSSVPGRPPVLARGALENEANRRILGDGAYHFKKVLEWMDDKKNYFDFDVVEDIPKKSHFLDQMTVQKFLERFRSEPLAKFLDSYTQSALGGHIDQVSALGFLLFYSSEIVPRYTWPGGTGGGSHLIAQKLWALHRHMFRTRSRVRQVVNTKDGVEVTFERDGQLKVVRAKKAILTTPLKVSAKIVPEMASSKKDAIARIPYADYFVHSIFTPKPFKLQGYDTWVPSGSLPFTDIIDGLWMQTAAHKKRYDGPGVLDIYDADAPPHASGQMTSEASADRLARALQGARVVVPELAGLKEVSAQVNRWASSIHLTVPGFMTTVAPLLVVPDGNIYYAGNNLGPPAFETALVTGKRAAEAVLEDLGLVAPSSH